MLNVLLLVLNDHLDRLFGAFHIRFADPMGPLNFDFRFIESHLLFSGCLALLPVLFSSPRSEIFRCHQFGCNFSESCLGS